MTRLLNALTWRTLELFRLISSVKRDLTRFVRTSRSIRRPSKSNLEAEIIAHYHVLEKGISMPMRKEIFGLSTANSLIRILHRWKLSGFETTASVQIAVQVLTQYFEIVGIKPCLMFQNLKVDIDRYDESNSYRELCTEHLKQRWKGDFEELINNRCSVRHFTGEMLDYTQVKSAVGMARNSPSVCNRLGTRVIYVTGHRLSEVLNLQTGNRGFGHDMSGALVVVHDNSILEGYKERNQGFIDAGLFAMNLMLSLSFYGIGHCPLNWCVDNETDDQIRAVLPEINDSMSVIMIIGMGVMSDTQVMPRSFKRPISEILLSKSHT